MEEANWGLEKLKKRTDYLFCDRHDVRYGSGRFYVPCALTFSLFPLRFCRAAVDVFTLPINDCDDDDNSPTFSDSI